MCDAVTGETGQASIGTSELVDAWDKVDADRQHAHIEGLQHPPWMLGRPPKHTFLRHCHTKSLKSVEKSPSSAGASSLTIMKRRRKELMCTRGGSPLAICPGG